MIHTERPTTTCFHTYGADVNDWRGCSFFFRIGSWALFYGGRSGDWTIKMGNGKGNSSIPNTTCSTQIDQVKSLGFGNGLDFHSGDLDDWYLDAYVIQKRLTWSFDNYCWPAFSARVCHHQRPVYISHMPVTFFPSCCVCFFFNKIKPRIRPDCDNRVRPLSRFTCATLRSTLHMQDRRLPAEPRDMILYIPLAHDTINVPFCDGYQTLKINLQYVSLDLIFKVYFTSKLVIWRRSIT